MPEYEPNHEGRRMTAVSMPLEERTLRSFEDIGFDFLSDWTMDEPRTPGRIVMPSGKILDIGEIYTSLDRLEFGNKEQIECLRALEFYSLVRSLHVDERYGRYNSSFLDEKDVEVCRRKYSKKT